VPIENNCLQCTVLDLTQSKSLVNQLAKSWAISMKIIVFNFFQIFEFLELNTHVKQWRMISQITEWLTNNVNGLPHFFQLIWTDIRTVGKAKVQQDPFAVEVFVSHSFSIMICQTERSTKSDFSYWAILFFFFDCI